MPYANVVYFREHDGTAPLIRWLGTLPLKASVKCLVYLARLQSEGNELRRPIADYLRDGVYELRPSLGGVHYRILYFFHGHNAIVVSHGLVKRRQVPAVEIERAVERMRRFRSDPERYTFRLAKGGTSYGGKETL